MKKLLSAMLLIVLTMSLCLVVGCSSEIALEWEDETEVTAEYCSVYQLRTSVYDKDGKTAYSVTAEVFDSKGNAVDVVLYRFDVSSMDGYKIVYTADVQGKSVKKEIKVKVVCTTAPVITISDVSFGVVGREVKLPTATALSAMGVELPVTFKVFLKNGDELSEQNLTSEGDGFIPRSAGEYVIRASATDVYGNNGVKECSVGVISEPYENEILDLNDPIKAMLVDFGGDGKKKTYHETFEGESGVVELNSQWSWIGPKFTALRSGEEYGELTEADFVVIRMFVPDDCEVSTVYFGSATVLNIKEETKGIWYNYTVERDKLEAFLDGTKNQLAFECTGNAQAQIKIYISKLTLVNSILEVRPTLTVPELSAGKLSSEYTLPEAETQGYEDCEVTVDVAVSYDGTPVTVSENKFTPDEEGIYTVTYTATDANGNKNRVVKTFGVFTAEDNEIVNFNSALKASTVMPDTDGVGKTYLSEFENESGVLQLGVANSWLSARFEALRSAEEYEELENADYAVFRIFVPANCKVSTVYYKGQVLFRINDNTKGMWFNYTVSKDAIANLLDGTKKVISFECSNNPGSPIELYISKIWLVGSELEVKPQITVSNMPAARLNAEYTLPQAETQGYEECEVTVDVEVGFNGTPVTVTANKFTPTEEGAYTVTYTATDANGNKNVLEKTLNVLTVADNEIVIFDSELKANTVEFGGDGLSKTYYETFENENGVVKFSSPWTWTGPKFTALRSADEYAQMTDMNIIVLRMYVPVSCPIADIYYNGKILKISENAKGMWFNYTINRADFESLLDGSARTIAFGGGPDNSSIEVYISKIYLATSVLEAKPTVTVGDMPLGQVGAEYTLPEAETEGYEGCDVTVDVTVSIDGTPVTVTGNKFTPTQEGVYKAIYTATDVNGNKNVTLKSINVLTVADNEIVDFSEKLKMGNITFANGSLTYDDSEHAVVVTANNTWVELEITPMLGAEDYAGFTAEEVYYIVLRLKIDNLHSIYNTALGTLNSVESWGNAVAEVAYNVSKLTDGKFKPTFESESGNIAKFTIYDVYFKKASDYPLAENEIFNVNALNYSLVTNDNKSYRGAGDGKTSLVSFYNQWTWIGNVKIALPADFATRRAGYDTAVLCIFVPTTSSDLIISRKVGQYGTIARVGSDSKGEWIEVELALADVISESDGTLFIEVQGSANGTSFRLDKIYMK